MGYLTKKQYLRFFSMMQEGPRVRWFHRIPFIGWRLFQKALREYSLEQIKQSIRQHLLTGAGEFNFHPDYGMPPLHQVEVNAPAPEDVSEEDRANRVLPDITFTIRDL